MDANELDEFAAKARSTAVEYGALVIDAEINLERSSAAAEIEPEAFFVIIAHLRPRAIYMHEVAFDLEAEIDGELIEEPRLKAFERKWRKREGQLCRVSAWAWSNGVFHSAMAEIKWISEFRSELIDLGEIVDGDMEQMRDADARERRAERRKAMHTLLADPRFNAPKGSKAKREYLAEALFPEMSPREIIDVVSDAESELWLGSLST